MSRRTIYGVGALAAATLLLEITLTRLLALAQYCHFAFPVVSLALLALLMGLPFPLGLAWLEREAPALIPWAWAVSGCASVVAAILAAILALSCGFAVVLMLGAACYAGAAIVFVRSGSILPVTTLLEPRRSFES